MLAFSPIFFKETKCFFKKALKAVRIFLKTSLKCHSKPIRPTRTRPTLDSPPDLQPVQSVELVVLVVVAGDAEGLGVVAGGQIGLEAEDLQALDRVDPEMTRVLTYVRHF